MPLITLFKLKVQTRSNNIQLKATTVLITKMGKNLLLPLRVSFTERISPSFQIL